MSSRDRTPDAAIRFICNQDITTFFPEYHPPVEEVETPRISNPIREYVGIHVPGERRIGRIRPVPWYEPRKQQKG